MIRSGGDVLHAEAHGAAETAPEAAIARHEDAAPAGTERSGEPRRARAGARRPAGAHVDGRMVGSDLVRDDVVVEADRARGFALRSVRHETEQGSRAVVRRVPRDVHDIDAPRQL